MRKPPSITFSHMGLYASDIPRMEAFYTRFLGFTVTDRGELNTPEGTLFLLFLSRDPTEHHQLVFVSGRPTDLPFNIINQVSFRADSLDTLRSMHRDLLSEDYRGEVSELFPVCHGNALSIYVRDPEGNRIELFIDTPWYVHQPMRIPVDLALPNAELWKSLEEKVKREAGYKTRDEWVNEMSILMGYGPRTSAI